MSATTFEDRLARLATEGAAASAPKSALAQPKPVQLPKMPTERDDATSTSAVKVLGACFGGALLGFILATIISIGLIEGSPWGPGSDMADFVMIPSFVISMLLIIALIPTTIFFRRAQNGFSFVASALVVLMISFLI